MVYSWQHKRSAFFSRASIATGTALFTCYWLTFKLSCQCSLRGHPFYSPIYNWCAQLHAGAMSTFETVRKTLAGILRSK
jgi:hypothetical protein